MNVFDAIHHGDLERVKVLVNEGADIHSPRPDGYTPLERAVESGRAHILQYLIEQGADINQKPRGMTPLTRAVLHSRWDRVELLLEHGADPFHRLGYDYMNMTVFEWVKVGEYYTLEIRQMVMEAARRILIAPYVLHDRPVEWVSRMMAYTT